MIRNVDKKFKIFTLYVNKSHKKFKKNNFCTLLNNKNDKKIIHHKSNSFIPSFVDNSKTNLIKIDFSTLNDQEVNISQHINQAFGKEGLGLIAIKNVPNLISAREKILKKGFEFYHLDENILKQLEKPEVNYLVGFNKARTYTENEYEYLTNAFYARTQTNKPSFKYNKNLEEKYQNVWPEENVIKDFKQNFLQMGSILHNVLLLMLKHFDDYLKILISEKNDQITKNDIIKIKNNFLDFQRKNDSICRLISYFPVDTLDKNMLKAKKDSSEVEKIKKNWCGWHRDFGLLTALIHPLYFNKKGEVLNNIKSGLIVQDRKNNFHEIKFEENEILIQTGDAAFFISGGNIISTPHCVKITEGIRNDIYRATFVNFFEPSYDHKLFLPEGIKKEDMFDKDPFGMKDMFPQFNQGCFYKDFIESAAHKYYPIDKNKN